MSKYKFVNKMLSMILSIAIVCGLLVGCGSSSSTESTQKSSSSSETSIQESSLVTESSKNTSDDTSSASTVASISTGSSDYKGGDYKIGVDYIIEGSYNVIANKNVEENAITAFGGTPMSLCANGSVEQMMSDFENMIDSGCKGILIWFLYDDMLTTIMQKCQEAGVYFAFSDKAPSDPDIVAAAKANPYFVGTVVPNQSAIASKCAEAALNNGCKNAIICSPGVGDATGEPRIASFTKTFEAGGGKVITKIQEQEAPDVQTSLENFLSGYDGTVDVIFCTGSDRVEAAHNGAQNAGFNDVKICCGDLNGDVLADLDQDYLISVVGDSWAASFYSYVLLVNALNGTPILDENGNVPWIDTLGCFSLENSKQVALYQKYFIDNFYYSVDECHNMTILNNPSYNYQTFVNDVEGFSFESRMKQRLAEGAVTKEELTAANVNLK